MIHQQASISSAYKAIEMLKFNKEGVESSKIRALQPSTSAQNIIGVVTSIGYKIKAIDLGSELLYILLGIYDEEDDEYDL